MWPGFNFIILLTDMPDVNGVCGARWGDRGHSGLWRCVSESDARSYLDHSGGQCVGRHYIYSYLVLNDNSYSNYQLANTWMCRVSHLIKRYTSFMVKRVHCYMISS